jgi:predicted kinase
MQKMQREEVTSNMKVIFLKGLPASGKSTWALTFVHQNPDWIRVNKDDLRAMLHNSSWSKNREEIVLAMRDKIIEEALKDNLNVIVDDTNFAPYHEKRIRDLARQSGADFEIKFFDVSLEECLERNAKRTGIKKVPDNVIVDMYNKYVKPLQKENTPFVNDPKKPKCVVCDLDGTLALMKRRGPFDFDKVSLDEVNIPVFHCLSSLVDSGTKLIFVSGRDDSCEELTKSWLQDKCTSLFFFKGRMHDPELYMRKTGDKRKDSIVKEEIYKEHILPNYYVQFVLDDRNQVVDHLRELGLTVFQVAPGNF